MDNQARIAELQEKIRKILDLQTNHISFEYDDQNGSIDLEIITVNPRHNQSFLYHSVDGRDKIEALETMLNYVEKNNTSDSTYTIQWSLKGDNSLHTSYFRSKNIMDAIDKFYYGRDIMSVTVFSVVLNPIS
ncbi:MAG: putative ATP-grasp superfamily ATP-dependent carboligase [Flavobacteriales bacterium]|jgi:predicted ATP-grasp superfamily ATP-dependent carboligase